MMLNIQLLDEKIERSGFKHEYLAKNLGISRQGLYNKRKGKVPFRIAEIYVLTDLLKLSDDDKHRIFFADKVES